MGNFTTLLQSLTIVLVQQEAARTLASTRRSVLSDGVCTDTKDLAKA